MRVKIDKDAIKLGALKAKASAYYDDAKVEEFVNNFGITSDNVLDSNGKISKTTSEAFVAVTKDQVAVLQKIAMDDLGQEVSYEEAITVLESVLPKKLGKFLNVEISEEALDICADDVVTVIPRDKSIEQTTVDPINTEVGKELVSNTFTETETVA